ncbi:hypothetical protein Bbelb_230480 [Branchiostoma belcheri]|nr:hypothetical protein Bbelb_230480 [Branchiostoma belcheri]
MGPDDGINGVACSPQPRCPYLIAVSAQHAGNNQHDCRGCNKKDTYLQRALKRQVRSLRRICNMCVLGIQRMKQMQIRIDSLSSVEKGAGLEAGGGGDVSKMGTNVTTTTTQTWCRNVGCHVTLCIPEDIGGTSE